MLECCIEKLATGYSGSSSISSLWTFFGSFPSAHLIDLSLHCLAVTLDFERKRVRQLANFFVLEEIIVPIGIMVFEVDESMPAIIGEPEGRYVVAETASMKA